MKKILKTLLISGMTICTIIVALALLTDNKEDVKTTTTNTSTTNTQKTAPPMVPNVDYTDYISIESHKVEVDEGTTRGRAYITLKNNSNKELNYVRVDIYFVDESENVIGSTFTNSSNSFLPGATQTLDRYVTWEDNYAGYYVVVTNAK